MGRYLTGEPVAIEGKRQKIAKAHPFRVLNHPLFDLSLSHRQIKSIEDSFRNRLAHNALIDPNCILAPGSRAAPFEFRDDGSVVIWVKTFHGMVNSAWEGFDVARIHPEAEGLTKLKRK